MLFEAICVNHMGRVRFNNEDNFLFNKTVLPIKNRGLDEPLAFSEDMINTICVGVFDGMGGAEYGEEASYLAAVSFRDKIFIEPLTENPEELLVEICTDANQLICNLTKQKRVSCIGTTVAVLYVHDRKIWICNLGDSRIYVLKENGLQQVSVDHTDAAYIRSRGIKKKPQLTQHLGIEPNEMLIEPFIDKYDAQNGDKYLLCSDGLTDMVEESVIESILREGDNLQISAQKLLRLALDNGGKDNTTIILCQIKEK